MSEFEFIAALTAGAGAVIAALIGWQSAHEARPRQPSKEEREAQVDKLQSEASLVSGKVYGDLIETLQEDIRSIRKTLSINDQRLVEMQVMVDRNAERATVAEARARKAHERSEMADARCARNIHRLLLVINQCIAKMSAAGMETPEIPQLEAE